MGAVLIVVAIFLMSLTNQKNEGSQQNEYLEISEYSLTRFDMNEQLDESAILVDISTNHEIKAGGSYILFGESKDTFVIDVEEQVVHIVLNGVDIRTQNECAILIKSAGKVVITLAEESKNILACNGTVLNDYDVKGAIHAECDLTINGTGNFYVYCYAKDAIYSKDIVKIVNGNSDIFGARDGIRGNDGVAIYGGVAKIQANECALRTTKSEKGNIVITGGNVKCISKEYGMYAAKDLLVKNCLFFSYGTTAEVYTGGIQQIDVACWQNYTEENGIAFDH